MLHSPESHAHFKGFSHGFSEKKSTGKIGYLKSFFAENTEGKYP